jgi:hypothetical protein
MGDVLFDEVAAAGMRGSAAFSPDGLYRYRLDRIWGSGPAIVWVMLNPSTANGRENDPTMRRLLHFSRRDRQGWYGRLVVVNVFAWRSSNPADLRQASDPVGPENDRYIAEAVAEAATVVAAWGAGIGFAPHALERADAVMRMLPRPTRCLGWTQSWHPRHPLYVRSDVAWEEF